MATRQTVASEVVALVGAATREPGVGNVATYIDLALRDIDRDSPRAVKLTLTGDGTDEYALASPWESNFSRVTRVRWVPSNDFNAPAQWLNDEQYEVEYDSTGASQIRLSRSPSSSDRVVVEHTARHTLTEAAATTTLSDTETGALARRAAVLILRAAAVAQTTRVPQGTDVDFVESGMSSSAGEYRRLADDYDAEYRRLLGLDADASSRPVFVSTPAQPNGRNARPLTHPRRSASWLG